MNTFERVINANEPNVNITTSTANVADPDQHVTPPVAPSDEQATDLPNTKTSQLRARREPDKRASIDDSATAYAPKALRRVYVHSVTEYGCDTQLSFSTNTMRMSIV